MKFKTKDLKLAALRYYDNEHKGLELTAPLGYTFLYKKNDEYFDVFNPGDDVPVFERTYYTNDRMGEDYGTKVRLVSEESRLQTGPCYLLEKEDSEEKFSCDEIKLEELEDYVLNSPLYFMCRSEIANDRLAHLKQPLKMYKTILKDRVNEIQVSDFFDKRMEIDTVQFKKQK